MQALRYRSPLGEMLLCAGAGGLCGAWFEGQAHFAAGLSDFAENPENQILRDAAQFLDAYFSGNAPEMKLPLSLCGTPFQCAVWEMLRQIPFGQSVTYGEIAAALSVKHERRVSARAVGGAVGRNPLSVIVPCHRVLGAGGMLTGYAGGLARKRYLLTLEHIQFEEK